MATLIPTRSTCLPKMTPGERRVALRLEEKLEDDYLLWYDVPIGPKQRRPDFVVLHPSRGFLVLEVKDWKLDTLQAFDKSSVSLITDRGQVVVPNPLTQARSYALEIVVALQRDPALINPAGTAHAGKLIMPWGCGVILTNISRAQFEANSLGDVIPSHLVICQDEMLESQDPERFQESLWNMYTQPFPCRLSLPQMDRFRWHMFPEIRIPAQGGQFGLFTDSDRSLGSNITIPDLIKVMDLQQEQLARSLGEGHRVIHGVAGSGKTMILGYRSLQLAKLLNKPVLVLCYNKTLAARLQQLVGYHGQSGIVVRNFHAWCTEMLRMFHVAAPTSKGAKFWEDLVNAVVAGVDSGAIPRGQYGAVLIDEGHDFQPDWLRLVVQMVDPSTNSLLVLYDDTQSIYGHGRRKFSFASVGIEARGRTTILGLNYRNTLEVLSTAKAFAAELLAASGSDEDEAPNLAPESAGRRGPIPELIRMGSLGDEARLVRTRIEDAVASGRTLDDIAVIYRNEKIADAIAAELDRACIRYSRAKGTAKRALFDGEPSVKLVTIHSSKGLEFPLVLLPAVCALPAPDSDESEEARLLYVAMTRSLEQLVLSHHAESVFTKRLSDALASVSERLRLAS
jgi:hypothetical protein